MFTCYFLAQNLQMEDFQEIKAFLLNGKVVAFPTETVYGLGVDWQNEAAIEKLFELKKRPLSNPMTLHVSSGQAVERLAVDIPPSFYSLVKAFWPGPLTIVLKKSSCVSSKISQGETVGVRMPHYPALLILIEKMGGVLLGTSANLSGRPPCTHARDVVSAFGGKIAALIDGGDVDCKKASTVLSLAGDWPRLLRQGPISREMIEKILGEKIQG